MHAPRVEVHSLELENFPRAASSRIVAAVMARLVRQPDDQLILSRSILERVDGSSQLRVTDHELLGVVVDDGASTKAVRVPRLVHDSVCRMVDESRDGDDGLSSARVSVSQAYGFECPLSCFWALLAVEERLAELLSVSEQAATERLRACDVAGWARVFVRGYISPRVCAFAHARVDAVPGAALARRAVVEERSPSPPTTSSSSSSAKKSSSTVFVIP